jgi:hypothetical protein
MRPSVHVSSSRAWFPGRYVPVRHIQGIEAHTEQRRGCVQVAKTTIHGTAAELRSLARQLLLAAELVDSPRTASEVPAAS